MTVLAATAPKDRARPAKRSRGRGRVKTLATLAALALVAPLNAAVVVPAWLVSLPFRTKARADAKTVLVSGGKMTKAGSIARAFHQAGHRVVLAETAKYRLTGHRFSRAVSAFATLPEPTDAGYAAALREVVEAHGVDLYVPVCSPVASYHDSVAAEALPCPTVHLDPDTLALVDDKHRFANAAREMGLDAPKSIRVTSAEQVMDYDFAAETRPFILKSIAYDAIRRLDLTFLPRLTRAETRAFVEALPISEDNPWVMQEFIEGAEFCTHGTVVDGRLTVHICCESSPFQINYDHIDRPDIRAWVERFVARPGFTGQVSLDFMEAADDGRVYAIECNPRTHSAITLFNGMNGLPEAYLGEVADALEPTGARPTYWLYHEVMRLARSVLPNSPHGTLSERLRILLGGRDAVFSWRDPLPFFMLHHVHIPSLLWRDLREGRGWAKIDFNIGKLVQAGGD